MRSRDRCTMDRDKFYRTMFWRYMRTALEEIAQWKDGKREIITKSTWDGIKVNTLGPLKENTAEEANQAVINFKRGE